MIEKIKQEIVEFVGNWYINYLRTLDKIIEYKKGNITFHVLISSTDKNSNKNKDIILKNLNRMHKFTNNSKVDVYLSLSPFKKQFNENPKIPLSNFNVNSGLTIVNIYGKPIDKKIYILRQEECGKVMFHEFIHHMPEIHSTFSQFNIKRLQKHFNIKSDIDPNEAIVEFWATVMFLKQISEETNKDFYELFKEELKYSLYKSNQLFELQKKNNGIWYDSTHAYCYIIFKTIIMYNLLEFQKIYTFPYNNTVLTDFFIKYSKLPKITSNPTNKRSDNSLCFMVNSDE